MSRIAILTHSLHTNYGGLLQAFALQHVLRDMGHDVKTVWHDGERKSGAREHFRWLQKLWLRHALRMPPELWRPGRSPFIRRHTDRFILKNIAVSKRIFLQDIAELKPEGFDAWIVGSDQVWSTSSPSCLRTMFLDFLDDAPNKKTRRLSYAASFGKETWTPGDETLRECAALAKKFDAISVRETSGVAICEKQLGVAAVQLPDPTLLLPA
ncbi:MAG: polysaccharide pyruvyl transferase family protein, partial [Puniceicoccales bacterium]|nr:polysaccharide pyruvyl transferase family protein [Puniceicoccales bacterium]